MTSSGRMTKCSDSIELTPAADACLRRCAEHLQRIARCDAAIDPQLLAELYRLLKAPTQFLRRGRSIAGVVEISPRARLLELQERLLASTSRVHPGRSRA